MTKSEQGETRREIAEQVARQFFNWLDDPSPQVRKAIGAIEAALKDRDERAAEIIREHRESDRCEGSCWAIITAAIRKDQG